ncbi:MAG TPA: HD domain-containing protein [Syntrophales bacterium]|nr:HD domain-containing protein [Syntrophales bacterium]HOD97997.1 HD domain-containing protein [Syntrophales bacterium]HOH73415.1 HD domain-containing protein [Syntrophales bacterium]HQK78500.1 HD domain-containing protein [Syntrophales bacterium]
MDFKRNGNISEAQLVALKNWFSRYVRSFDAPDPVVRQALALKVDHSLRVCDEILNIGGKLTLGDGELRLAKAMALVHDIGRFNQYFLYKTFVDKKSADHAQLGVAALRDGNALAVIDNQASELILKAVSYHNRLHIPEDEGPACVFFTKLLRDADKLDILHLVSTYYYVPDSERNAAVELDLPDAPEVSDEILNTLLARKMVRMEQLRTLNDFKLLQMAWVYDLNFPPTFQFVYRRKYLERIRDTLPASDGIDRIYAGLMSYLKEKSGSGS